MELLKQRSADYFSKKGKYFLKLCWGIGYLACSRKLSVVVQILSKILKERLATSYSHRGGNGHICRGNVNWRHRKPKLFPC